MASHIHKLGFDPGIFSPTSHGGQSCMYQGVGQGNACPLDTAAVFHTSSEGTRLFEGTISPGGPPVVTALACPESGGHTSDSKHLVCVCRRGCTRVTSGSLSCPCIHIGSDMGEVTEGFEPDYGGSDPEPPDRAQDEEEQTAIPADRRSKSTSIKPLRGSKGVSPSRGIFDKIKRQWVFPPQQQPIGT
eukprot:3804367-Amphidinium_carterae.1